MERKLILTGDGSHSISVPDLNVAYHSIHGAIQESMHVFINAGFYAFGRPTQMERPEPYKIFEMGFGTGLNTLLTLIEAEKIKTKIYYETVELHPLTAQELSELNYCDQLHRGDLQHSFETLHHCEWELEIPITENFIFKKRKIGLINYSTTRLFDLIYFDAFAPAAQPELWTKEVFDKIYSMLLPGGILITYCSKGDVRRAMVAAGFKVEKLPGPPHKREMIRAVTPINGD